MIRIGEGESTYTHTHTHTCDLPPAHRLVDYELMFLV